jgi:MYXO-CTERM domain-containing protein
MTKPVASALVPALLLAACVAEEEPLGTATYTISQSPSGLPMETGTPEDPRPSRVAIEPLPTDGDPRVAMRAAAGEPVVIYLNRRGGTYSAGRDDSRENRSSVLNQSITIAPWNVSDSEWNKVMSCMRSVWSPFNVVITDQDPGTAPHYESIMAGRPADIGAKNGVLGIAPFLSNCGIIPNAVAYTFAQYHSDVGLSAQDVCETAAQEVAHAFGVDHELLPADPMTYLRYNGKRSFRDQNADCGENRPRECGLVAMGYAPCSDQGVAGNPSKQNSFRALIERLGPGQPGPPLVAVDSPADGARVGKGFIISASVTPLGAEIEQAQLLVDGVVVQTVPVEPFAFNAPSTVSLGEHKVTIRATDRSGLAGDASISVIVAAGVDPGGGGGGGGDYDSVTGGCSVSSRSVTHDLIVLIALVLFALAGRRRRGQPLPPR